MRPLAVEVEEISQISHEVRSVIDSVMIIVCYLHFLTAHLEPRQYVTDSRCWGWAALGTETDVQWKEDQMICMDPNRKRQLATKAYVKLQKRL